jgi:hypothetical protein
MKWLVLVCAVVMLLRSVSGKLVQLALAACPLSAVMIRIERARGNDSIEVGSVVLLLLLPLKVLRQRLEAIFPG